MTEPNQGPRNPARRAAAQGETPDEKTRLALLRSFLLMVFLAGLKPNDLFRMLRGHVLVPERGYSPLPCRAGGPDDQKANLRVLPRDVPQCDIPMDRVPDAPRCRLMCPLHERARSGQQVPCREMVKEPTAAKDRDLPELYLELVLRAEVRPCRLLHQVISAYLPAFLGLRPGEPWPAGNVDPVRLRTTAQWLNSAKYGDEEDDDERYDNQLDEELGLDLDRMPASRPQAHLRFLLGTGRLSQGELREMLDHLILTDGAWLPCKDDPQRNQLPAGVGKGPRASAPRYLCPLQVRGLRDDRTVPCAEALHLRPAASLLKKVREEYPKDALLRRRPPQPVYWRDPDEQPGGPEDLVQERQLRPCEELNLLLTQGVVWVLKQATAHQKEDINLMSSSTQAPATAAPP